MLAYLQTSADVFSYSGYSDVNQLRTHENWVELTQPVPILAYRDVTENDHKSLVMNLCSLGSTSDLQNACNIR